MTETRICKKCGAEFTARRITGVVHCPACRAARRAGTPAAARTTHTAAAHAGHTCTVVVGAPMIRCGKAAVTAFKTERGEIFAECAEHAGR